MQKAGHRAAVADGSRLAGEHEEGGLEGIFGIVDVPQHAAADAHDHPLVAPEQQLKSTGVPGGGEAPELRGHL